MSGRKAPAIPLLGSPKPRPRRSTKACSSGVGVTPELSPPLPLRYSRNGSASTRTATDGRECVASNREPLATGKAMSLKDFSKGKNARDLPCLVKVVDGHRSLCEFYSFGLEQMFVVLEKKNMLVVTCKDHKGGSFYAIPINTTSFSLVPFWMDAEGIRPNSFGKITANELLQSKALPPVIVVSEQFECGEHPKKTMPVGTLLFLNEQKKQVKGWQQGVLHAKSESGEMVQITPDCNGRFSILANDVRLSLKHALDHLKPPFTMRTISDSDTLSVNVFTVERVHKEDVLIGMMKATEGTSLDDAASFSRMVEIPVSLNLTVVTMVAKQQKVLDEIYDFAHSEYNRIMCNPATSLSNPADTVNMDPNPSYIDISTLSDHMKVNFSAHPASSVKAAPSTPSARTPPSTPLELSVTAPNDSKEHIYDDVDNYEAIPTAGTQQKASPDSKVAAAPFQIDQSASKEEVPTSMKQDGSVEDSDANIAYLKKMQRGDVLQLLDAMNLSVYKDAFEQEHIDGERMARLSGDMLSELGVSKSLHRMRLMKIISGRTSASSFISIPQFYEQQS